MAAETETEKLILGAEKKNIGPVAEALENILSKASSEQCEWLRSAGYAIGSKVPDDFDFTVRQVPFLELMLDPDFSVTGRALLPPSNPQYEGVRVRIQAVPKNQSIKDDVYLRVTLTPYTLEAFHCNRPACSHSHANVGYDGLASIEFKTRSFPNELEDVLHLKFYYENGSRLIEKMFRDYRWKHEQLSRVHTSNGVQGLFEELRQDYRVALALKLLEMGAGRYNSTWILNYTPVAHIDEVPLRELNLSFQA